MSLLNLSPLTRRILLPAFCISALSLAGLSAALMIQADRVARRSLEAKAQSMASFLEHASVTYLINFDLSALETFTKQVVKDPDFVFAVFLDDKGKPLTPPVASGVEAGALVVTHRVADPQGKLLATLRLGYTSKSIANPLFPALRSGHRLFQRPSHRKQIPSRQTNSLQSNLL